MNDDTGKTCYRCQELKPVGDFTRQASRADGLNIWCKECARAYSRAYVLTPEVRAKRLAWRRENEKYSRADRILYLHGVVESAWLEKQGGGCAICGTSLPGGRWNTWHVDHDHQCCGYSQKTCGQCVRGLLCATCNVGLGQFKDDPDLLRAAADYLEQAKVGI